MPSLVIDLSDGAPPFRVVAATSSWGPGDDLIVEGRSVVSKMRRLQCNVASLYSLSPVHSPGLAIVELSPSHQADRTLYQMVKSSLCMHQIGGTPPPYQRCPIVKCAHCPQYHHCLALRKAICAYPALSDTPSHGLLSVASVFCAPRLSRNRCPVWRRRSMLDAWHPGRLPAMLIGRQSLSLEAALVGGRSSGCLTVAW